MIYPSVIMQIKGFVKNDNSLSKYPNKETNKALVVLDNNQEVIVEFISNSTNLNSLYDYLKSKLMKSIKSTEITQYASQLAFTEDPKYIELINKEKNEGLSQKEACEKVALNILKEKNIIKSGSIIRAVLSISKEGTYQSRSIISSVQDGKEDYTTSGILNFSVLDNHIPLKIQKKHSNYNANSTYLSIQTSDMITVEQKILLLQHIINSANTALKNNKKFFFPYIYVRNSQLYSNIKQSIKENNIVNYVSYVQQINPVDYISVSLPVSLTLSEFNEMFIKKDSPLKFFAEFAIKLNFSNEDPSVKKEKYKKIFQIYNNFVYSDEELSFFGVYNIPTPRLEPVTSWGFLKNNLSQNINLSKDSQDKILNQI